MRILLLLSLIFLLPLAAAEGNRTYGGDARNFTCCKLWCCYPGSQYCDSVGMPGCSESTQRTDGGVYCRPSQNAAWMSMCGDADFIEWTTPNLEQGSYTLNVTGGCVAWGGCADPAYCTGDLMMDGVKRTTLVFRDTNTADKGLTASNYTFEMGELGGVHTFRVYYTNDCFSGTSGDRNFYLWGINLSSNETLPDLFINGSELWMLGPAGIDPPPELLPANRTWNANEGQRVEFIVTVRNIGNKTASNFSVRFKDDDDPENLARSLVQGQRTAFSQERFVESLPPNSSINLSFTWNVTDGSREISFFADSGKTVAESNESNNIAFHFMQIKQEERPDYTPWIMGGCGTLLILALLSAALLIWRAASYQKPAGGKLSCPRCGMVLAPGAAKCPVCGKKLGK